MTERLYYRNSFLYDFVAALLEARTAPDGRIALVLDRTAFYPTSGGQVFDTGWIELEPLEGSEAGSRPKLRVAEVTETDSGEILHIVEDLSGGQPNVPAGATRVRGFIDVERRRDHMQQHSGQHVLSAAFVELFNAPTVSFHMGDESCTIDLDTKSLTADQVRRAEHRANEIVWEDRPVEMKEATADEARAMGVRKIPEANADKLRLIEFKGFDLCACGGTHVKSSGQIGNIQIRKIEKVKQGFRVEFVCGERAIRHARKDFEVLTEAASVFSTHIWEVPTQIRKTLDDAKQASKREQRLLEEIAELTAARVLGETVENAGTKIVSQVLADRDASYVKLLAQKLTSTAPNCVALLAAGAGQPTLVFAQSPGMPHDMGSLMKQAMAAVGGRGGGNRDMAQGGVPDAAKLAQCVETAAASIQAAPAGSR